ncbi:MAG: hypothetical protein ACFB4I_24400 [Cyanophyceae cyanobacterium]
MSITVFEHKQAKVIIPTTPYRVRCNCAAMVGQFTIGAAEDGVLKGREAELVIVKTIALQGDLGQTKDASWLQVWFIPVSGQLPQNLLMVTHLKTQSADNLGRLETEFVIEGQDLNQSVFKAEFVKRAGAYGDYWAVRWTHRAPQSEVEQDLLEAAALLRDNLPLFDAETTRNMKLVSNEVKLSLPESASRGRRTKK